MACQNPEPLFDGLKRAGLISRDYNLNLLVKEALAGNQEEVAELSKQLSAVKTGDRKDEAISFLKWENQPLGGKGDRQNIQRVPKVEKAAVLACLMEETFEVLKEHLHRDIMLKKHLKIVRESVNDIDDLAVVHCDWAENLVLKVFYIILH